MSGGISSLSNATYIIQVEEVQVENKGPVKATTVAGRRRESKSQGESDVEKQQYYI